jgi:hypothetical protein
MEIAPYRRDSINKIHVLTLWRRNSVFRVLEGKPKISRKSFDVVYDTNNHCRKALLGRMKASIIVLLLVSVAACLADFDVVR